MIDAKKYMVETIANEMKFITIHEKQPSALEHVIKAIQENDMIEVNIRIVND